MAVSVTILSSPFLHCFEQFGWHTSDGAVEITWDNNNAAEPESYSSSEENSDEEQDSEAEPPVTEVEGQEQMADSDCDGAL